MSEEVRKWSIFGRNAFTAAPHRPSPTRASAMPPDPYLFTSDNGPGSTLSCRIALRGRPQKIVARTLPVIRRSPGTVWSLNLRANNGYSVGQKLKRDEENKSSAYSSNQMSSTDCEHGMLTVCGSPTVAIRRWLSDRHPAAIQRPALHFE